MARTALTAVTPSEGGIDLDGVDTPAELTDGNSFVWAPGRKFYVNNGDDAALTVTVQSAATVGASALAVADLPITVAAGARRLCGPFGPEYRRADGTVWIDYAGTTPANVTVAALD
ncbi:hypothetical protein HII36_29760 [Nonomuraea sp. NN258]|uniref:hypothetical protein n=1 Tax=Nonomuraea antri TaxID=2730852 RepID=UPI0015681023|nr:hypothetical protein [Nonomuraea antri]NRQ35987.1 hypothetical protein [Nonomuraea antri]